ncbi:MAG TPA: DinB family protein [Acidobacteriaceae bacterium]|nr:DinB family protein [Acidobacteriaceae bacterium]
MDDSDARTQQLVAGLGAEQLNWQPQPGAWSVGQCLEHLCMTHEAYLPAIAAALPGKPVSPVQEITPGWFGRWFMRSFIEPSPATSRTRAPRKIVPGTGPVDPSILDRFLKSTQAIRETLVCAQDLNVNRIRFKNPLIGVIHFTVGTGFQILSGHLRRHLLQAERVKDAPGFPGRVS